MPPSGPSMGLVLKPAKSWADKRWAVYSTYHANVHLGLLNLLYRTHFQESKCPPEALAGLMKGSGRKKGGEGTGNEETGERRGQEVGDG